MLTISPAVSIKNVPNTFGPMNYILFPDSEKKDLYYAMAEQPTFDADPDGNPAFNLTWYFGGGEEAGGICTMTVALPLPDMSNADVRNSFAAALTTDASTQNIARKTFDLCQAMDANDAAKTAALKAELGFSDALATQKKGAYNKTQDWKQFLPSIGSLDIRPVPFKSGTVSVQAFANAAAYQTGTAAATSGLLVTTPSLFNSNAAVVTFNLKETGANLFWHGLGGWSFDKEGTAAPKGNDEAAGGVSVIAVTYKVEFDGLLPAAKATVTLKKEVVAKLNIEDKVHRSSWGRTYHREEVTGKEYTDAVNSSTEIELPAVASESDKDNVQKLLTDWSAKQLEEMVASQMPEVKLGDLDIDGARKISTVNTQSRTYKLTQAVAVPKYPQGQLRKLDGLKPGLSMKKFFQLINLNDKPYFDVGLTVAPPAVTRLKVHQVDRFVITDISYCNEKLRDANGKQVNTLEFVANQEQKSSITLAGTFAKGEANKSLKYNYLVAYADGTPSFRVNAVKQDGNDNYLDMSSVDIGVLSVNLNAIDLPWDVVSGATVDLKYDTWEKKVLLKKDSPPTLVVQPFGKAMTGVLSYRVTLALTSGTPNVGPWVQVQHRQGAADISLQNPLGDAVYNVGFQLDDGVSKAQLRVEYTLPSKPAARVFTGLIQLDSTKPEQATATWKVPAFTGQPSTFKVTKAQVTAGGTTKALTDLSGGLVSPLEPDTSITVLADGLSNF